MKKRLILSLLCCALLSGLVVGCNTADDMNADGEEKVIKIGFTGSITGNGAAMGEAARDGMIYWCEQNNYKMGDYNVELYIEDDEDVASTIVTKVQKLVEEDEVDVLLAPSNSGGAAAISDYIIEQEVPLVLYYAHLDSLTKNDANNYMIRTGLSCSQGPHCMGDYVANVLGHKKAAIITYDFTFGYELAGGFAASFVENGGEILSIQYTPMSTPDFSALITNIPVDDIDVLVYHVGGGDAVRFASQLVDSGILNKIDVVTLYNGTDECVINDLPLELAQGHCYSPMTYSTQLDNEMNREFQTGYFERFGVVPAGHAEYTYTAMQILDEAVSQVGIDDPVELIDTMRNEKNIETIRGTIPGFDEYGQIITPVFIRELQVIDGKLENVPVYTYEDVSQFWHWDPETFMESNLYTKEYLDTQAYLQ